MPSAVSRFLRTGTKVTTNVGGSPTLSPVRIPEGASFLCLRSLQTQSGDFDFLSPKLRKGSCVWLLLRVPEPALIQAEG